MASFPVQTLAVPANTPMPPGDDAMVSVPGGGSSQLRELPADGNLDLMEILSSKLSSAGPSNTGNNSRNINRNNNNNETNIQQPLVRTISITKTTPDVRTANVVVYKLDPPTGTYTEWFPAGGAAEPIVIRGRHGTRERGDGTVDSGVSAPLDLTVHEPASAARASTLVFYADEGRDAHAGHDPRCRVHPTRYRRAAGPAPCAGCGVVAAAGAAAPPLLRLCRFCAGWAARVGADCFRAKACVCGALDARAWRVLVDGLVHHGPFSPRHPYTTTANILAPAAALAARGAGVWWDWRQAAVERRMYRQAGDDESDDDEEESDEEVESEKKTTDVLESSDSDSSSSGLSPNVHQRFSRVTPHYASSGDEGYEADVSSYEHSDN